MEPTKFVTIPEQLLFNAKPAVIKTYVQLTQLADVNGIVKFDNTTVLTEKLGYTALNRNYVYELLRELETLELIEWTRQDRRKQTRPQIKLVPNPTQPPI